MSKSVPHPFIKWAGGKARMAAHVISRLPDSIGTYYEPMLGGGAVFIELAKAGRFRKAVLNDLNSDLGAAWTSVRDDVDGLVRELKKKRYRYDKEVYLAIRAEDPDEMDQLRRAARLIYLNRTCFNGLYRVNLDGKFNVPFGRYEDPVICDAENLRAVSALLQGVEIMQTDFARAVKGCVPGDAVYFDPPYLPLSGTSNFTSYTEGRFGVEDHKRLAETMAVLGRAGVRVVASNSSSQASMDLFGKFDYDCLKGQRSVGGPGSYRKSVKEIVAFTGPRS